MELASPAADWLPVVNGRKPDFPDGTKVQFKWSAIGEQPHIYDIAHVDEQYFSPHNVVAYRVAPAQPAEGERYREADWLAQNDLDWHPTSTPPAEGRVVDVRRLDFVGSLIKIGKVVDGKWLVSVIGGGFITPTNHYEWRYPPGERVEATINAAGQGATSDKATVASATALKGRSAEQLPVPAAPQRQNLALWLALRGRAPWPTPAKVLLAFPESAYWTWRK